MSDGDELTCPKCGSRHVHAERRGFNMKRGLALGLTIAPGVGLVGGFVGANKIWLTCLKCGYRFRAGAIMKPTIERVPFDIGSRLKRTPQGAVGQVTAIEGDAVTVRWPDNRTSIHLGRDLKSFMTSSGHGRDLPPGRDLKPFEAASGEANRSSPAVGIGSKVRRTVHGSVGEVTAVDGEAVTVRWPDNRSSTHLSRDLKPLWR